MKQLSYIEITGLPGVGKTTVYNQLINSEIFFKNSRELVSFEWATQKKIDYDKYNIINFFNYFLSFFFKKLYYKRFGLDNDQALRLFCKTYPELLNISRKSINISADTRSEYEVISGFYRFLKQAIIFTEISNEPKLQDKIVLTEQFMHHSVLRIFPPVSGLDELTKEFLFYLPKAEVLIIIIDDEKNILERVRSRKKIALQHIDKSDKEILNWSYWAQDTLIKSGNYLKSCGRTVIEEYVGGRDSNSLSKSISKEILKHLENKKIY